MSQYETSTAAKEAIRIADKYLPGPSFHLIELRKQLALEIAAAIEKCEVEFGTIIVDAMDKLKKTANPVDGAVPPAPSGLDAE